MTISIFNGSRFVFVELLFNFNAKCFLNVILNGTRRREYNYNCTNKFGYVDILYHTPKVNVLISQRKNLTLV